MAPGPNFSVLRAVIRWNILAEQIFQGRNECSLE